MAKCDDIKPEWVQVARRLQQFSSSARGRSKFVTITIAVDGENTPIFWYEPRMRKVEPKMSREDLIRLLSTMADD